MPQQRPSRGKPTGAGRGQGQGARRSGSRDTTRSDGPRFEKGREATRARGDRSPSEKSPTDKSRSGNPRDGEKGRGSQRAWSRDRKDSGSRYRRDDEAARTDTQRTYDGPEIPEHITGKELDRAVVAQLKSLPEKLAARVARHLAAAGVLMDSDPATAYQHTLAAKARAGRLAVVREAVGEAAYAAGEYAEALAELRAAKRMNGAADYVAIMADCERALGRPDRALALIKNASTEKFSPALLAEVRIVEAGARRDRGELDAALRTLEGAPLTSKSREPWVARLRYAYADALLEAGRRDDAVTWFHRTEAVDSHVITDAADRAAQLESESKGRE